MEAAFRVFADKGFGQVRIDDVCTAAGYTRGAFYSNFDSLEELFFTLYDDRLAAHRQQLRTEIEKRLDGARDRLTLPDAIGDISNAARAVVAAYDAVTIQLLLDGDLQAARTWLTQLLTALLNR
jgi:AcrR family transcriptional regulator